MLLVHVLHENTQIYVCPFKSFGTGYGELDENSEYVDIYVSIDGIYNIQIIGTRKDKSMKDFWDKDKEEVPPETN